MNFDLPNASVSVVCSTALFFLLKNSIPGYFSKKGENLATKQDIGAITKEVEGAKDEFTKGIERLKTELQFANSVKLSIKNETRTALVDCYEKLSFWTKLVADNRFSNYDETNVNEIIIYMRSFDDAYFKVLIAEAKMELYVGYGEYTLKWAELKKAGIELQMFMSGMWLKHQLIINNYLASLPLAELKGHEAKLALRHDFHQKNIAHQTEKREEYFALYGKVTRLIAQWQPVVLGMITALDK